MEQVYVGLDLGSSSFHQIAISGDGSVILNRSFCTSELNLRKAFSDLRGQIQVHLEAGELAPWAATVISFGCCVPRKPSPRSSCFVLFRESARSEPAASVLISTLRNASAPNENSGSIVA
jgi:hypothetical protein